MSDQSTFPYIISDIFYTLFHPLPQSVSNLVILRIAAITDVVKLVVGIKGVSQHVCHLALLPSSENVSLCLDLVNNRFPKYLPCLSKMTRL